MQDYIRLIRDPYVFDADFHEYFNSIRNEVFAVPRSLRETTENDGALTPSKNIRYAKKLSHGVQ